MNKKAGNLAAVGTQQKLGMAAMLELCPETHLIATLKALIDVRIGLIAGHLRLAHESFHSAQRLISCAYNSCIYWADIARLQLE